MPYVSPSPMQELLHAQVSASEYAEEMKIISERVARHFATVRDAERLVAISEFLASLAGIKLQ